MDSATNSIQSAFNSFIDYLPTLIGAILMLIAAWIIAKLVKKAAEKGLRAAGFTNRLQKWGVASNDDQANRTIDSLGKVLYSIVWLLFLPGILDLLGLESVSRPISNMFQTALNFLPNLIGAAIILLIGVFVGRFVKNLVYNLAYAMDIDKWMSKLTGSSDSSTTSAGAKDSMAKTLANIVYILILIPIFTAALEVLGIESITEPITNVLNTILAAIPNIIVALILLAVGFAIAKFVGNLLTELLQETGVNKVNSYLKSTGNMNIDLAKVIGQVVMWTINIFFLVEALNVLNLDVLNRIGSAIIDYLPNVLFALIILGLGIVGGSLLSSFISKSTGAGFAGEIVKYILIVMSVFMALNQLNFAPVIVTTAFMFIIGGLSVAFAIAFGVGGRDFARRQLDKAESKGEKEANSPSSNPTNNNGPKV